MNDKLRDDIANNFSNTELGFLRIRKNLEVNHLTDLETEELLKEIILLTSLKDIENKGKNYYFNCSRKNAILTINSFTLTVITAKQIIKN